MTTTHPRTRVTHDRYDRPQAAHPGASGRTNDDNDRHAPHPLPPKARVAGGQDSSNRGPHNDATPVQTRIAEVVR